MRVIGVDLDGTLATSEGWKGPQAKDMGQPNLPLVAVLEDLHEQGCVLCIWSCRANQVAKQWLEAYGLLHLFDYINESPYPTDSAKASFDIMIDDVAFHWNDKVFTDDLKQRIMEPSKLGIDRDASFTDRNPQVWYQGTGTQYIDHFEKLWHTPWLYRDFKKPTAFMTICSHAKPYSKSHIHSSLRRELHQAGYLNSLDYIHLSGAGIIPSEAEMMYPFNAYDWNGDEATVASRTYLRAAITRRLMEWRDNYSTPYSDIVVYLRSQGNTLRAVKDCLELLGDERFRIVETTEASEYRLPYAESPDPDDCLIHPDNIDSLMEVLDDLPKR